MALELATRVILRSAVDGSPLTPDEVRRRCCTWAQLQDHNDLVTDAAGRGGARVTTSRHEGPGGSWRWDLSLVRTDDDDDSVDWVVELSSLFEADRTSFVARLRRESTDHRLRPFSGAASPPAVIRELLGGDGIDCYDGPLRVEPRYRELEEREVDGFVDTLLFAEDRRLPIIGVAKVGNGPRLDVARLCRELTGFAHVMLVDRDALPSLGRRLGNLSLDRASARLWWPGIQLDDAASLHPDWVGPYEDPASVLQEIRASVLVTSRDRWREPSRFQEFARAERRRQAQAADDAAARVRRELESLRSAAAEHAEAMPAAGATESLDRLTTMATDLEAVRAELERVRDAQEHAESAWVETQSLLEASEADRRGLRGQLEGALAQVKQLRSGASDAEVLTETERFRRDVVDAWEARLTTSDRAARPLADFEIRDGFVSSIAAATADRGKVVDTVMEIACGLAANIAGRQLHALRSGRSGNAPQRRRDADGAKAWRCSIQVNSPSARRVHYWAVPGGTFEFVSVVIHDVTTIEE